jgi:hypothetical protein
MPGRKNQTGEKKRLLTDEQKKILANEIEKFPALWKLSDEGYMKRDVTAACWKAVSEIIEVPGNNDIKNRITKYLTNFNVVPFLFSVTDCKSNWKSLKDALNYRQKSKPGKSGDGAPEPEGLESDELAVDTDAQKALEAWSFYDSLKFLLDNKPKRR